MRSERRHCSSCGKTLSQSERDDCCVTCRYWLDHTTRRIVKRRQAPNAWMTVTNWKVKP